MLKEKEYNMAISLKINIPRIAYRGREVSHTAKAALALLVICTSCGQSAYTVHPHVSNSTRPHTREADHNKPTGQDPSLLCNRISEIKALPVKDEITDDPSYNALVEAGEAVLPCLIEKITDTTEMPDPRQVPKSPDVVTRVGDVAYFVLIRIVKVNLVEFLPSDVQQEYKEEGMYAYFKFVERQESRQRLQDELREWYRKKYINVVRNF
jgi:hypothetical protein